MKFLIILFFVVLISYGQLLGMHVWQDDNALFFKLAHIEEKAGYLSAGPFGSGPYKYIATPYIPIYDLFGHNTIPYFVLMILLHFISAFVVYKVASAILGKVGGRVAGLLYAAGYIASDGFIRIFNSAATSISVIAVSLFAFSYLTFFRKRQARWYFFSLLFYFLAIELAQGRTHYLIAVVFAFEILFFRWSRPLFRGLGLLLARLAPFGFVFYKYFVENADSRSANVGKFLSSILGGDFYQVFGFLSSIANLFVPDWATKDIPLAFLIVAISIALIGILKGRKWLQIVFGLIFFVWLLLSREIFNVPQIVPTPNQVNLAFLGGTVFLILASLMFTLESKYVRIYLLFGLWALVNLIAYSAYNPLVVYESINRYLAHSFFAVVFLLGIVFIGIKRKGLGRVVQLIVIVWGVGNLVASVFYQKGVVTNRSIPAREFYEQLKSFVPKVEKGDAFYFDVAASDRPYFNDSFSVASMPETTAIAWRYGVDRYDIKLFATLDELETQVKEGSLNLDKIRTFWYSGKKLVDTTSVANDYFLGKLGQRRVVLDKPQASETILSKEKDKIYWENKEVIIDLPEGIVSSVPTEIAFEINAFYPQFGINDFPMIAKGATERKAPDPEFLRLALAYRSWKESGKGATVTASSFWRERKIENLNDSDISTIWQPDRIKFREGQEWFQIDLGRVMSISELVWVNGFGNNTPTKYKVEVSKDGRTWTNVKEVSSIERIDDRNPRVITFGPIEAREVRMTIAETLNSDSPGIAEAWVVPAGFEGLGVAAAERFLASPFSSIPDENIFNMLKNSLDSSKAKVYWQIAGDDEWATTETSFINLVYDGRKKTYSVSIPPKGLTIKKIKLSDFAAPSDINVSGLQVQWLWR